MGKNKKRNGEMGKDKRRKLDEAGTSSTTPAGAETADAAKPSDALDIDLIVRVVNWLTAHCKAGLGTPSSEDGQVLLEALQPVILARAGKYEEDAKDAKGAAVDKLLAKAVPTAMVLGKKTQQQAGLAGGIGEDLDEDDVAPALLAFKSLAANMEVLATKECKPLRAALHPLVATHLHQETTSPVFRITRMLGMRSRWAQALPLLAEVRIAPAPKRPKLGAYQRWVRALDVGESGPHKTAILDALLRCAAGSAIGAAASPTAGSLKEFAPFQCPGATASTSNGSTIAASKAPAACAPGVFSVIFHEPAHDRKPPNHHDLDIYSCAQGAINLREAPTREVERHAVLGVAGASMLSNVLSAPECASIRGITEAIGYRKDLPLSSPLEAHAQNVVLLASELDNDTLFSRIRDLLPPEVDGDRLVGLNRRWRIYRHATGDVHRKHFDNASPACGTNPGAGGGQEYLHDAFDDECWSRLAFIMYLNDDFEGGCTTFFVPNAQTEGLLEARPVKPQTGCAAFFNHGETGVPLLLEGSPVTKGTKYVLRTEVIYKSALTAEQRKAEAHHRSLVRKVGKEAKEGLTSDDEEEEQSGSAEEAASKSKFKKVIKRGKKGGKRKKMEGQMSKGKHAINLGKKGKAARKASWQERCNGPQD